MAAGDARLISDIAGHEAAVLSLDLAATAAHSRFVFDTADDARAFATMLFDRNLAEVCPPACRLLTLDGVVAGLVAVLPPRLVLARRLGSTLAAAREPRLRENAALRRRLQLAATTIARVENDEAYLARLAVHDRFAGQGWGRWLLGRAVEEARALGLNALVLDVAAENIRAANMYAQAGFCEVSRRTVEDLAAGRRLTHVHLRLAITAERA